jgi:hypothetical protein
MKFIMLFTIAITHISITQKNKQQSK